MADFNEGGSRPPKSEAEPKEGKKFQLLYDNAKKWPDCIMTKEWSQEDIDNWEDAGYRTQDGHYTEVGLFDSEEEMNAEIENLKQSRGDE